jgi:hypothetical protein
MASGATVAAEHQSLAVAVAFAATVSSRCAVPRAQSDGDEGTSCDLSVLEEADCIAQVLIHRRDKLNNYTAGTMLQLCASCPTIGVGKLAQSARPAHHP